MKNYTTAERLQAIMYARNLKQTDILRMAAPYCEKYNIKLNRNDLSQYVNGKVLPGQFKLTVLALALNVSEVWLMGYDVPMEREISQIPDNIIPLPDTKSIPLLGEIACGKPLLATENISDYIKVDISLHVDFALKCKGDSMINARIFDGDVVYIRQQPDVDDGEIAAVLIGEEATLKKVYKTESKIILRPCNPMYDDIVYSKDALSDVRILGKAIMFTGLIRHGK